MDYIVIWTFKTGQAIWGRVLSDPLRKLTPTLITSSECHFGWINKSSYTSLIKTANKKYKHQIINFLLSLSVFHGFSINKLQYRYFNGFVLCKIAKNKSILLENGIFSNIIILKSGLYEMVKSV